MRKEKTVVVRRLVQMSSISLFLYLIYRAGLPLPGIIPVNLYSRIDGLFAIFMSINTKGLTVYYLPAAVLMFLILVFSNFFCLWVCPFGGTVDMCNIVIRRRKWNAHIKIPVFFRKARFLILAVFLLPAVLLTFMEIPNVFWGADPLIFMSQAFTARGKWLAFFLLVLAFSILIPRFWCNHLCPLGCLYYILGVKCRAFFKNIIKKIKKTFKN